MDTPLFGTACEAAWTHPHGRVAVRGHVLSSAGRGRDLSGCRRAAPLVEARFALRRARRKVKQLHGLANQVERAGDGDETVVVRLPQGLAQRQALDDLCCRVGATASLREFLRRGAAL